MCVTVVIVDDIVVETNQSFTLELSSLTPSVTVSIGGDVATVTILDEDGKNIYIFFIMCMTIANSSSIIKKVYSRTSEERTLWEQAFCPLFRGCPYLRGSLIFQLHHCLM